MKSFSSIIIINELKKLVSCPSERKNQRGPRTDRQPVLDDGEWATRAEYTLASLVRARNSDPGEGKPCKIEIPQLRGIEYQRIGKY
jgi:hypothetical protein